MWPFYQSCLSLNIWNLKEKQAQRILPFLLVRNIFFHPFFLLNIYYDIETWVLLYFYYRKILIYRDNKELKKNFTGKRVYKKFKDTDGFP